MDDDLATFPRRLLPWYYEDAWPNMLRDEQVKVLSVCGVGIRDYYDSIANDKDQCV